MKAARRLALFLLASCASASLAGGVLMPPCDKNHYILDSPCALEVPDPLKWTWAAAGAMNEARSGHTATLLANGLVLVSGGNIAEAPWHTASAELYDPATGRWTSTGEMQVGRASHAAVLMPDGKVFVAGGVTQAGFATASAELYDPATGRWSATGSMHTQRAWHTMTLLASGAVLVVGGSNENYHYDDRPLGSTEIYDPATGSWSRGANLGIGRINHTATYLPDDTLLVAGGSTRVEYHGYTATAEIYDPRSKAWLAAGQFSAPLATYGGIPGRSHSAATSLADGSVLLVGGHSDCSRVLNGAPYYLCSYAATDRYVPNVGWVAAANLNAARNSHTITRMASGHLLVVGGDDWTPGWPHPLLDTTEVYDPASSTWKRSSSLGTARTAHTATLLADGTVLVAGGFNGGVLSSAEIFGPP